MYNALPGEDEATYSGTYPIPLSSMQPRDLWQAQKQDPELSTWDKISQEFVPTEKGLRELKKQEIARQTIESDIPNFQKFSDANPNASQDEALEAYRKIIIDRARAEKKDISAGKGKVWEEVGKYLADKNRDIYRDNPNAGYPKKIMGVDIVPIPSYIPNKATEYPYRDYLSGGEFPTPELIEKKDKELFEKKKERVERKNMLETFSLEATPKEIELAKEYRKQHPKKDWLEYQQKLIKEPAHLGRIIKEGSVEI